MKIFAKKAYCFLFLEGAVHFIGFGIFCSVSFAFWLVLYNYSSQAFLYKNLYPLIYLCDVAQYALLNERQVFFTRFFLYGF